MPGHEPRIGLCAGMVREMSVADLIALAGRHGFTSIMFLPTQWSRADAPAPGDARRMLDDNGIKTTSMDGVMARLPRLADPVQQYLLPEDSYFRIAEEIGACCFNVPHYLGDPKTPVAEFADALGPLAEKAATHGIALGLEFLPGTGIPDVRTANRISEAVGAANLGVTIDTWHLARCRGGIGDIRALPPGRIKAFQISDRAADEDAKPDEEMWGRLVPGEGALPLRETIAAVWENAPGIAIDAEIFSKELLARPDDETAARVMRALKPLVG
jgi:sugar phosphate isomerase/epimerase